MIFIEHGIFEVKVENQLLLVDATGPFNEELILKYESALEECVTALECASWHQIITLHQISLFTPEAEQALIRTLIERKKRGLQASVVVLADVEGKSLVKTQMANCYQKSDLPYSFVATIAEAKQWLASHQAV